MTVTCPTSRYSTSDNRFHGWKTTIPGGRTLATPAFDRGRLFIGGGFGSHEFYSFDAQSGEHLWCYRTHDDGPTAAVVFDNHVVFNTESCELEVVSTEGRAVWKKWLGDPLMSIPAIADGRIFMAFPDTRGDRHHYLACFDLYQGTEYWRTRIAGEIITAPVLADGNAYLTTLDGTIYCFSQATGSAVWNESLSATSSPVVFSQQCYFSRRKEILTAKQGGLHSSQQTERLSSRSSVHYASAVADMDCTTQHSDYLDFSKRSRSSWKERDSTRQDTSVGFASSKGDSKMHQAQTNLGSGSVFSCWAYQGSKPFVSRERLYSAMGDTVKCVRPQTEELIWQKPLHQRPDGTEILDSEVTPPVLVNGKVFVATIQGEVCCLSEETGKELWRTKVEEPIVFQPAVAMGRIYLPTYHGNLICLETGDPNDDGWYMWGGSASHSGLDKKN